MMIGSRFWSLATDTMPTTDGENHVYLYVDDVVLAFTTH